MEKRVMSREKLPEPLKDKAAAGSDGLNKIV